VGNAILRAYSRTVSIVKVIWQTTLKIDKMKKTILLILTIIPFITNGQVYFNFPTDSAIWNQVTFDWGNCKIVIHYGLVGDTTIAGKQYSKLYGVNHCFSDNQICVDTATYKDIDDFDIDSAEYIGGVREDSTKKIYFYDADNSSEYLLYDFGLNINDTFCFDYFNIGCYKVSGIDSTLINGQYRKTFHFNDFWGITWIEGVGNSIGWFALQIFGSGNRNLLCFKQNNDTLINNYGYCSCSPGTSINEYNQSNTFFIFPNPADKSITIDIGNWTKNPTITIYNVFGQEIEHKTVSEQSTSFDIDNLSSGIYFLTVMTDKHIARQKFVKQ
jgi:hypothetical protein